MSEDYRDRLQEKEQQKNPGGTLNNAWARAYTGAPSTGCLVNIVSVILVIIFIAIVRACSN
ncbi:hypothetical protein GCM10008967_30470 [Bacillus carboniphilus]|uniref:Uncharacterized protein n=1 Tax=Bacillus carboniphilus TaxID=86663 RepID=A0ABP3G9Y9_9BACI